MKVLLIVAVLVLIFVSGCIGQGSDLKTIGGQARDDCMQLCQQAKANGTDLGSGPCVSNNIIDGWVCDVAHSPRTAADDLAANQCPAFGDTASHFVEVDPECSFIRSY